MKNKGKYFASLFTLLLVVCATSTQCLAQTDASEVVLYAAKSQVLSGNVQRVADAGAASGSAILFPDLKIAKLKEPLAAPTDYFEVSFYAEANRPYRLWLRGRALGESTANDSVYVQFSASLDALGAAAYRVGTNSALTVNLEDCSTCGVSGWGWQDTGWGVGVLGPVVYFEASGVQTLRVQPREDGLMIDQIVLSSEQYMNTPPGGLKDDQTVLPSTLGTEHINLVPHVSIITQPLLSNGPSSSIAQVGVCECQVASGAAPLSISFVSQAEDLDGSIISYHWDFGDSQTSNSASAIHTYQSVGIYTATLTVTDNDGATASASVPILVANTSGGTAQFRMVTYNIQRGKGTDDIRNLDRTAATIARTNPDVVVLSEAITNEAGDQALEIAESLRSLTGQPWSAHWAQEDPSSAFVSNVILTKWPILCTSKRFIDTWGSAALATVAIQGKPVNFFATHLWWSVNATKGRLRQIANLKAWTANFVGPQIIAGDFNFSPMDTQEYAAMTSEYMDSWAVAMNAGTATAYPDNPVKMNTRTRKSRLDYIYFSGAELSVKASQVPDTRDLANKNVVIRLGTADDKGVRPSDHNIVVTTFILR
jgi:endonuclease/exonuclease/phosphatase family metal-dependent hydrolase